MTFSSASNVVRTRTRASGAAPSRTIRRVASIPSRTGIRMSITTTSGRSRLGGLDPGLAVGRLSDHLDARLVRRGSSGTRCGRAPGRRRRTPGSRRSCVGHRLGSIGRRARTRNPRRRRAGLEPAAVERDALAHADQAAPAAAGLAEVALARSRPRR